MRLQSAAGNRATTALVQRSRAASPPTVQRDGPTSGSRPISFRGQTLTTDPAQLQGVLTSLISARGQAETETFAYAFLRMGPEEKIKLQLAGVDPANVDAVQAVLEPQLTKLQTERTTYLSGFGGQVVDATKKVLEQSKKLLKDEERKYTETFPAQEQKPDLEALRAAAKTLAAKRRLADAAAEKAQTANRAMIDQNAPKSDLTSPFPQPIMPYFPNPELREQAGIANEAWWKLEQEYGALRTTHEKTFPVLAMYSSNEDGGAAGRLEDLPTWGPFADWRMRGKVVDECRRRILNVEEAESQLDAKKAWQLPKMVDATLAQQAAVPYRRRWVRDDASKRAAEEAESQAVIAGVGIAVIVVTAALTGGAALAVEGTLAAGVFSALGAVGTGVSAGLTISSAYKDIRDYQFQKAATASDLDSAKSIAAGEPTLVWVALDLLAAAFDVAAARAAFQTAAKAIKAVQAGEEVVASLKAIEGATKGASTPILSRVIGEAEASGALQQAILAEGKKFSEASLGRTGELIEQGLGRIWGEEFAALKARQRILPFTKEGLGGALGPKTAERLMGATDYEKTIGMYHLDSGKAFVRPAAEGDLVHSMVHEMTHAIQGPQRTEYASFIREFEAYAAQRQMMRQLNQAYGWQPKSSAWLLEANDWEVAKHIRLEYGYRVPPWVLETPLAPTELDKTFKLLTKRLQSFSTT